VTESLPAGFAQLRADADVEGISNVARLQSDWERGAERFDKPGEILLAGFDSETLAAIGGLTIEPDQSVRALRLRRLYVRPAWRKRGIGRALATALIEHGFGFVEILTVNAGVAGAAEFWGALGFRRVAHEGRTHELRRPARNA
jgi:GNAT superfamily N-acetyltransferase